MRVEGIECNEVESPTFGRTRVLRRNSRNVVVGGMSESTHAANGRQTRKVRDATNSSWGAVQQTRDDLGIAGGQVANVILADICSGFAVPWPHSRDERQATC